MSYFDALSAARTRGLDLVEVAPNAVPPVCRLMDYGRYKYDQEKRDREARKSQKTGLMKEVRMHPLTDDHDVDFKTKAIQRFLDEGDKVKVTVQFRGAQMRHPQIGRELLEGIVNRLKGVAVVERPILMEGRNMSMMLGGMPNRPRPGGPDGPNAVGAAGGPSTTAAPVPAPLAEQPRSEAAPGRSPVGGNQAPDPA